MKLEQEYEAFFKSAKVVKSDIKLISHLCEHQFVTHTVDLLFLIVFWLSSYVHDNTDQKLTLFT